MGIHILEDRQTGYQALYCSTSMQAFGPVFYPGEDIDAFLNWWACNRFTPRDPRSVTDRALLSFVDQWREEAAGETA